MTISETCRQKHIRDFIQKNVFVDTNKLILNPPAALGEHVKLVADQIKARQKAKDKLRGWATNFDLIMPPPISIEQASSDATSDYKQTLISGELLVDLTGGMGVDCLKLSKSFDKTIYVEQRADLCEVFQSNAETLGKSIEVVNTTATDFLDKNELDNSRAIAFIDPGRRDDHKKKVFKIEDCSPNLLTILPLLKKRFAEVLVKFSPLLDIKAILRSIPNVETIHVLSVKNDCKEILVMIDFAFDGTPEVKCINLDSNDLEYSFTMSEEEHAEPTYSTLGKYVYEPNSSIMKGGAFNALTMDGFVDKLGINTHLYTSKDLIIEFPGKAFEVIDQLTKKNIKEYAMDGKINVITRNYPINASEFKKKWKLKDGGEYFVIGFRNKENKAQAVIARRIDS